QRSLRGLHRLSRDVAGHGREHRHRRQKREKRAHHHSTCTPPPNVAPPSVEKRAWYPALARMVTCSVAWNPASRIARIPAGAPRSVIGFCGDDEGGTGARGMSVTCTEKPIGQRGTVSHTRRSQPSAPKRCTICAPIST